MSHSITVEGGKSVRLPTKGKYCDRDIVVTAQGVALPTLENPGGAADLMEGKQLIDGEGNVVDGTFTITPELTEQGGLISQIKAALQGKAAGGSGLPTQEKAVEITENGTVEVLPDDGYTLSKVAVTVNVAASGGNDVGALLENTLTEINSNATKVVGYACRGLSELKTVNLPNATSIGTYAFYSCEAMDELYAPNVVTLGTYAFYSCEALLSINFPLATSIPTNCFYACRSAVKADCGVAGSIAANAFAYCEAMESLILRKTSAICTLANTSVLRSTPIADGTGYIYVPAALIEEYKAAANWSTYADQFRVIEDYPDICGGVE